MILFVSTCIYLAVALAIAIARPMQLFDPNSRLPWAPGIANPGSRVLSLHCLLQAAAVVIYFAVAFVSLKLSCR